MLQDFDHIYINLVTQTRQTHQQQPSATLTKQESLGVPSDIEEVDEGMEDPESEGATHIQRDGKRQSSIGQSQTEQHAASSSESVIDEPMLT